MSDTMNLSKVDNIIQGFLNDKYISASIILFLIFYTVLIAPKLDKSLHHLLNSPLYKLLVLFSIGYIATKNPSVAIIMSVAFIVTISTMHKHEMDEKLVSILFVDATTTNCKKEIPYPKNKVNELPLFNKLPLNNKVNELPFVNKVNELPLVKELLFANKTDEHKPMKLPENVSDNYLDDVTTHLEKNEALLHDMNHNNLEEYDTGLSGYSSNNTGYNIF